jgi:hypothetical protein
MITARLILATTALVLTGCSNTVEQDIAGCKMKAIELFKPNEPVWRHGPAAAYVRECMLAAGYLPSSECGADMGDFSGCYRSPDSWWR